MELIPVGRIISVHRNRGEVRFHYYNAEKEAFYRYTSFSVKLEDCWVRLKPTAIRFHNGHFLIRFDGIERPEELFSLVKRELFVRKEDLPLLEEGEYYIYQLIGLSVIDETEEVLGQVAAVINSGATDIIVVKGTKEHLIPMVEGHILEVNLEAAYIRARGLEI